MITKRDWRNLKLGLPLTLHKLWQLATQTIVCFFLNAPNTQWIFFNFKDRSISQHSQPEQQSCNTKNLVRKSVPAMRSWAGWLELNCECFRSRPNWVNSEPLEIHTSVFFFFMWNSFWGKSRKNYSLLKPFATAQLWDGTWQWCGQQSKAWGRYLPLWCGAQPLLRRQQRALVVWGRCSRLWGWVVVWPCSFSPCLIFCWALHLNRGVEL